MIVGFRFGQRSRAESWLKIATAEWRLTSGSVEGTARLDQLRSSGSVMTPLTSLVCGKSLADGQSTPMTEDSPSWQRYQRMALD